MQRRTLTALAAAVLAMAPAAAWSAAGIEVAAAGTADQSIDKQDAFGMGSRIAAPTQAVPAAKDPAVQTPRPAQASPAPTVETDHVVRSAASRKTTVPKSRASVLPTRRPVQAAPALNARITERSANRVHASVPVSATPAARITPRTAAPAPSHRPDKIRSMEEMERKEKSDPKAAASTAGVVFSTILKLGLVAALMYGVLLALKAVAGKRPLVHRSAGKMKLMDTVQLSPNSSVHLVKVDGKTLLIGCATGQVNLLQEIETSSADEEPVEESNNKFAEYLARYSEGSMQSSPAGRLAGLIRDCTDQLHKYQERLRSTADVKAGEGKRES